MTDAVLWEALDWLMAELPGAVPQGVQVAEGWPGDDLAAETLMLGKADMGHEWRTAGNLATGKREDTTIECWLLVRLDGGTATDVRRRIAEISGAVDAWLRQDMEHVTMGGLATWSSWEPTEWMPGVSDSARDGALRCLFRFAALRK